MLLHVRKTVETCGKICWCKIWLMQKRKKEIKSFPLGLNEVGHWEIVTLIWLHDFTRQIEWPDKSELWVKNLKFKHWSWLTDEVTIETRGENKPHGTRFWWCNFSSIQCRGCWMRGGVSGAWLWAKKSTNSNEDAKMSPYHFGSTEPTHLWAWRLYLHMSPPDRGPWEG